MLIIPQRITQETLRIPEQYRLAPQLGGQTCWVNDRIHEVSELPLTVCCQRRKERVQLCQGYSVCEGAWSYPPRVPKIRQWTDGTRIILMPETRFTLERNGIPPESMYADMEQCDVRVTLLRSPCTAITKAFMYGMYSFNQTADVVWWRYNVAPLGMGDDLEKTLHMLTLTDQYDVARNLITATGLTYHANWHPTMSPGWLRLDSPRGLCKIL